MQFKIRQQVFHLSAEKAMYWENTKTLLLADMHLSKETHFRKHGIAVPDGITKHNFQRLTTLVEIFSPEKIIVIGDLFHSTENASLALFKQWKATFSKIPFQLISGNHDILETSLYDALEIELLGETFLQNGISLTHHPPKLHDDSYIICGHIHPAIRLSGKAKQSLRLPCFWFGNAYAVMPAFGGFTGMKTIQAEKSDIVFAVAENEIIQVQ